MTGLNRGMGLINIFFFSNEGLIRMGLNRGGEKLEEIWYSYT